MNIRLKRLYNILLPLAVIALVMAVLTVGRKCSGDVPYRTDSGFVFGTSYNITYQSNESFETDIKAVLDSVDFSLSPFNKKSIITAVNENRETKVDAYFIEVFNLAKRINTETDGAFDITVAPLVNAWGFGFKEGHFPTDKETDSLRAIVGLDKVRLEGKKAVKEDPRIMLDCSAIAKGYAVDKIAEMLKRHEVKNFLVEIGGEIVAAGCNKKGKDWSIGVTKPVDDSLSVSSEMQMVMSVTDCAMATSGNYRNYYIKDGKKYAHTINPKTGRPAESDLLSATVIATTCAEADAFATGFMTMGRARALDILKRHPEMKYILIYDDNGKTRCDVSKGLKSPDGTPLTVK